MSRSEITAAAVPEYPTVSPRVRTTASRWSVIVRQKPMHDGVREKCYCQQNETQSNRPCVVATVVLQRDIGRQGPGGASNVAPHDQRRTELCEGARERQKGPGNDG